MAAPIRRLTSSWLTRGIGGEQSAPMEAIALRFVGIFFLILCIVATFTTRPHPGFHGRGAVILAALIVMVISAIAAMPHRRRRQDWRVAGALLGVIVAAAVLRSAQPHGIYVAGPYYVGIVAALRLERRPGLLILAAALAPFIVWDLVDGNVGSGVSILFGVVPWFFAMRLLHVAVDQRDALHASQLAGARAAAAAERGRLAREMHDVLAHSLSALALQLESTRLLARSRGVDEQVARAIDRAHHLAASGLDEARRAIATQRGDELPGPERIEALAGAFEEQSGLPVVLEVRGEPRELPPEARLAVYRTAQEALTNIRRHATADRVAVRLDYRPDTTVLIVEDQADSASAPPVLVGVGSGYGLTGMRERAELLGGELLAGPTNAGFRVELRLPAAG